MENIVTKKVAIISIVTHGYYHDDTNIMPVTVSMNILDEYLKKEVTKEWLSHYVGTQIPADYKERIDVILLEISQYGHYRGQVSGNLGDLEIHVQTDVDYITTLTQ